MSLTFKSDILLEKGLLAINAESGEWAIADYLTRHPIVISHFTFHISHFTFHVFFRIHFILFLPKKKFQSVLDKAFGGFFHEKYQVEIFSQLTKNATNLEVHRLIDSARGSINLTGAGKMALLYVRKQKQNAMK